MKQIQFTILGVVAVLSAIYAFLFFAFPHFTFNLALLPEKFFSGEWWRLLTYQFVHLNQMHLFENISSVVFLGVISTELRTRWDRLFPVYFLSGAVAILPLFIVSQFTALGASTAIYGGFGFIAQELGEFNIKPVFVIAILTFFIFIKSIWSMFNCGFCPDSLFFLKQGFAHFSGLMIGVVAYKVLCAPSKKLLLRGI